MQLISHYELSMGSTQRPAPRVIYCINTILLWFCVFEFTFFYMKVITQATSLNEAAMTGRKVHHYVTRGGMVVALIGTVVTILVPVFFLDRDDLVYNFNTCIWPATCFYPS